MPTGEALADLLSGVGGSPVNRSGLNAFVANSQARNGLVSAQTQDALIKAAQAQEQMAAHDQIKTDLMNSGAPESEATLARDFLVGSNNNDPVTALKALSMAKLGYGSPESQTSGQQMYEGKLAAPVSTSNSFQAPPGSALAAQPVQQSPQGVAQTQQTQAVTGLDVARAEEAHAQAKQKLTAGVGQLDPQTLDMAAHVVMADPTKMSSFAGYGQSGQAIKQQIQSRIAQLLQESGMTPDDMITHRAVAKASVGAAGQAAKQQQTLDAFMPLVKANSDRIMQLLDQVDATGGAPDEPIVNGFSRMLGRQLGSNDLAELHSVFTTYQAEIARLLASGPSMNGVISDAARAKVDAMAPETMTSSQARQVLNRVETETNIRRQGVHQSLAEASAAQGPVISPHTPGNVPATAGATDLPPGFHPLN